MNKFLETDRLIVQLTSVNDFDNILALRSDPKVQKYTTQPPATRQDIQNFLNTVIPYQEKHGHGMASVFEKDTGAFIGQAGIFHIGHYDLQPEIEIGYRFHVKHWGQGFATEVTQALVSWGFKHLNIDTIVSFVETENIASRRVLEKSGFHHVGFKKCHYGILERYEIYKP
ncbi:MAG TPA: GNAT family N-acetyltransferase [Gammaproteobacteria bacterium]|nr:GNAT family N-acetyltransferase [Gammaproteobacteria bacterium]